MRRRRHRVEDSAPAEVCQESFELNIPDNAKIFVDVDGTALNHGGMSHTQCFSLLSALRNRTICLLTSMGPVNLQMVLAQVNQNNRTLTRDELIRSLQELFNIATDRVIVPADSAYAATNPGKKAGDAFKDLIQPFYPVLNDLIQNKQTSGMKNDAGYVEALNAFRAAEATDEVTISKAEALRQYLIELGDANKVPLVFIDDRAKELNEVMAMCTEQGWQVQCYLIDTKNAADPHMSLYGSDHSLTPVSRFNPEWKNVLIRDLQALSTPRPHSFSFCCSGRLPASAVAADELIELLNGEADDASAADQLGEEILDQHLDITDVITRQVGMPQRLRGQDATAVMHGLIDLIKQDFRQRLVSQL